MATVLAISPHLDDAILSAGASLTELADRGVRVEVFTAFAGVPTTPLSPVARAFHADCGLSDDAIEVRRAEDRLAVAGIGAYPHHLDFLDAVYRRRVHGAWLCQRDRDMFADELPPEPELLGELVEAFGGLCDGTQPERILTSAAIGGHVDHRLTRHATIAAASVRGLPVELWEDLPYAVGRPAAAIEHARVVAVPGTLAWRAKHQAVAQYASQIGMLWPDGLDWWSQLDQHARVRGNGRPVEVRWRVRSPR